MRPPSRLLAAAAALAMPVATALPGRAEAGLPVPARLVSAAAASPTNAAGPTAATSPTATMSPTATTSTGAPQDAPTTATSPADVAAVPRRALIGGELLAARGLVTPPHSARLPKNLTARGWLLADLDTGQVLAARDPHGRYPPASTLKTLTALTLLPRLTDHQRLIVATAADANIEGSRVGLVPNGHYTVDLLFQAMLMASGNDAANALARAAGGAPVTVALMNTEARRLQAFDTRAATPSGLDGPGQATSAYDLALIARAALQLPDFRRYVAERKGRMPPVGRKYHSFEIANQNPLLYSYPGAFGVKTGFTDAARHTYVGAASRHGRRLVVTFLHAERRPIDMWRQAAALLDWGFALPAGTRSVGQLVGPADPDASSGGAGASAGQTGIPSGSPYRASTRGSSSKPVGDVAGLPALSLLGGALGAAALAGGGAVVGRRRRRRAALRFRQPRRWA